MNYTLHIALTYANKMSHLMMQNTIGYSLPSIYETGACTFVCWLVVCLMLYREFLTRTEKSPLLGNSCEIGAFDP
jgi:hypothetical protein